MNVVRQHLETEAEFMQAHDSRWKRLAPQQFVLDHGVEFEWSEPEESVDYGASKECFRNAMMLAFDRDDLTYVEGYGYTPGLIPCSHAWCVTEDGRVIDPTWRHNDDTCGFCFGSGEREEEVEWDDDGEATGWEERPCFFCEDGKVKPSDLTGTSYLGVPFETEWVVKTVMKKGTTGVLTGLLTPNEVPRDEALAHIVRVVLHAS